MKILQRFLFLFLLFGYYSVWGQQTSTEIPYYTNSGLVYYYFWVEDSDGGIDEASFTPAFTCNSVVTLTKPFTAKGIDQNTFQKFIAKQARPHRTEQKAEQKQIKLNHKKVNLQLIGSLEPRAIIFRYKNGIWTSEAIGRILYFTKIGTDKRKYTNSSSAQLDLYNPENKQTVSTTIPYQSYQVIQHFVSKETYVQNQQAYSQVKGFRGHDFTQTLLHPSATSPKHYLIFVNGYRGPTFDNDPSKNEVYMNDRTNYWFNIDNRFMDRIQPDTSFYIDGSFTVKTSNHHTKLGFGLSYMKCTTFATEKHYKRTYSWLNTNPNVCGFDWRKRNGFIAGIAFLNTLNNVPGVIKKDTIDIVCHSMGYAYTLGFLEAIEGKLIIRKLFILAPENANAGKYDWSKFKEVWQYGANLGQANADILCQQDGVAPQAGIPGLKINTGPFGRIFSPTNWPNKHFIHSHMVYSFDWIFDRIYVNQPGYIH